VEVAPKILLKIIKIMLLFVRKIVILLNNNNALIVDSPKSLWKLTPLNCNFNNNNNNNNNNRISSNKSLITVKFKLPM
jgi:hypothetical protein